MKVLQSRFLFLILFSAILLIPRRSFSQSFDECVELVKHNKYKEAIDGFEKLQDVKEYKASSSLWLAVLKSQQDKNIFAFDDFKKFFDDSKDAYPYFYAVSNLGFLEVSNSIHGKEVKEMVEAIAGDKGAEPYIRSKAYEKLCEYYRATGNFDAIKNIWEKSGEEQHWSVLGTFENVAGSGFDKDRGVVSWPQKEHQFINKINAPIAWVNAIRPGPDHWYNLSNHYHINDAIIYAQTFVTSNIEGEVLLKVGVSGSLKVWINDCLVGAESDERITDADYYTYKVQIRKGVNRVLLQIGSSEVDRSMFMVRFFKPNDELIRDLKFSSEYQVYEKAEKYGAARMPFAAEKFFEDHLQQHANDLLAKILLLNIYNTNCERFKAHKILNQLEKDAPHCTLISQLAIRTAKIDHNVLAESREKESVKTNDPESIAGLNYRYEDAMSKERWEDAVQLMNDRIRLYGESVDGDIKLISAFSGKNDNEGTINAVDRAYQKFPYSSDITGFKYLLILGGSKSLKIANTVLTSYLKTNYSRRVIEQLVENQFRLGEINEGKMLYRMLLENEPDETFSYSRYAMALYEMHDYTEAYSVIDKAIELAPHIGLNYYIKGLICNSNARTNDAIEMMKRSIVYDPTNYKVRSKLRELEGKKDLGDMFLQNNITELYNSSKDDKIYEKEDVVCLLNDKQLLVYAEPGASVEHDEMLFLVKSQAAIDKLKEYDIVYNSYSQRLVVEKAEVIKHDGSKVAAEKQKGKCVFSSLEIGDAVHLAYKLEDSYEGNLAEHFWDAFYFNNGICPVKISRYSLIVPSAKKFSYKTINTTFEPKVQDIDDHKLYVWEKRDQPKVKVEQPITGDEFEQLVVSSIPDWSYVANWYSDISSVKIKPDYEVKEKVAELVGGKKAKSDVEKARIIYNYIEDNFHYSNVPFLHSAFTPQGASRTLNAKLGDCKDLATLFVSMAREAGLDANLVLVSTKGNSDSALALPSIGFNHCIAQLHTGGKDQYIELTDHYLPFSAMYYPIINARGLHIPGSPGSTTETNLVAVNTSNRPPNINIRKSELSFSNDQGVIHRHVIKIGSESAGFRRYNELGTDEDKTKELAKDVTKEFNKTIKIDHIKFIGLNTLSDTAQLDYNFTVDKFTSDIVGMKAFKIPWTEQYPFAPLFSLDAREYPLDIWFLAAVPYTAETVTISLPAGKKLAEMPQDIEFNCPVLTFSIKYKIAGDKLVATRELRYKKDRIMPEEYKQVKETFSKITDADSKQIVFK